MKYGYLRDPLFLCCVAAYFLNRWVFKPFVPNAFSENYLNDLICIPFWVPIMLFLARKCRLRDNDSPPAPHEILVPLILWSAVFEIWLPNTAVFREATVADPLDILFYTLGALIAAQFWRMWYAAPSGATGASPRIPGRTPPEIR